MGIPLGNHHTDRRDVGATLVEALARRSRAGDFAEANRLVRGQRVQLNGNVVTDPAKLIRAGDVIKVLPHATVKAATRGDVRLVHVDADLVVVEKPPGVTTMREPGSARPPRPGRHRKGQATLEEMVARLLAERAGRAPEADSRRQGPRGAQGRRHPPAGEIFPVHRLDRDTSGLMLFARTPAAERSLTAAFKAREIDRSYLAVVHGRPEAMTITTHIVRDRGDGRRGSAQLWGKDPSTGQRAVTHIEPLERIGKYALVRCRLETGRTHQIRIHLAELGHPLCGEKEYLLRPDGSRMTDGSGAPRHALHAERLAFSHPVTGQEMRFASRLPPDIREWLDRIAPSSRRR